MIIPTYTINDVPACDLMHVDTQNEEEWTVYLDAQDPDERRARVEELLNEVIA